MAQRVRDLSAQLDVAAVDLRHGTVQGAQDNGVIGAARMQAGVAQSLEQGLLMPEAGFDRSNHAWELMKKFCVRTGLQGLDAGAKHAAAAVERRAGGKRIRRYLAKDHASP
jgi:hypothetical protein